MPHIITAAFEDFGNAQRALEALIAAGVTPDRVALIGESPGREVSSISGFRELSSRDDTLAQLHDLPLPEEEQRLYGRMVSRGHAVIAARVDRDRVEEAARILEMFEPVDLDRESLQQTDTGRRDSGGVDIGEPLGAALSSGITAGITDAETVPGTRAMADRTDDAGASELRTGETPQEAESTAPIDDRRIDERAGAPGVLALDPLQPDPRIAAKLSPNVDPRTDQAAGLFRRETTRRGRVRSYTQR